MITLHCDGASRGNPGKAGIGVVLYQNGKEIDSIAKFIGKKTNNQAEYMAVIEGIKKASKYGEPITIALDSELIVKQLKGEYRVKSENIKPLYETVKQLLKNSSIEEIKWVPREQNKRADELANQGIDTI